MVLETALADALYLNWSIPLAALPPAPTGLRYDLGPSGHGGGEGLAFFSLVLFRQVGLHPRGASWLALSYPQVDARLYVRDAAQTASVLLLRQLVPGWVVPLGRLVGGQPFSAAVCEFPGGLPRSPAGLGEGFEAGLAAGKAAGEPPVDAASDPRLWRWKFSAGARLSAAVRLGVAGGLSEGPGGEPRTRGWRDWQEEVAFFRDRTRAFWRQGETLRRVETDRPATAALPVSARIEQADWLETFLPFAPAEGWSAVHSAFLVPKVQLVFAFAGARELPVAAPMTAAG